MQMERMSVEDALAHLSRIEPRACTSMPSFVAAPRGLESYRDDFDVIHLAFECEDIANDRTWIVAVPFGLELPSDGAYISARIRECAADALAKADRTAKAVFN